MSLVSQTARVQYTLTGSGQTLAVPFYFIAESHLLVTKTVDGVDTDLVLTTNYTVAGEGSPMGGSVTLVGGVTDDIVTITRSIPFDQDTVLAYLQQNSNTVLERGYDYLAMQIQRLREELKRTIRVSLSSGELAALQEAARAGKALQFDEDGNLELTESADTSAAAAAASAAAAEASESAAEDSAAAAAASAAAADGLGGLTWLSEAGRTSAETAREDLGVAGLLVTNTSGLTLAVAAFRVGDFSFAGGTIAAVASKTQWLCVNLRTAALHTLPRNLDQGVVWLAKVVAGASTITTLETFAPALPRTRIPRTLSRTQASVATNFTTHGNSLQENGFGTTSDWNALLFLAGRTSPDFAMPSDNHSSINRAAGGTAAASVMASIGRSVQAAAYPSDNTSGVRLGNGGLCPGAPLNLVTKQCNPAVSLGRDCLILGLIANPTTDNAVVAEGVCRRLGKLGVEAIVTSDNASAHPGDAAAQDADVNWIAGPVLEASARRAGLAFVDTAAYVREMEWRGINPYVDSIHMNTTYGMKAWAEALAGVLAHTVKLAPATIDNRAMNSPLSSANSTTPGGCDVEFGAQLNESGGALVTGLAAGTNRLARLYGATDTTRYDYETGDYFHVGHPLFLAADIFFDPSVSFTVQVKTDGSAGTVVKTITHTGNALSYAHTSVYMSSELAGVFANKSYTLVVTSGTLRLFGIAYQTPEYRIITPGVIGLSAAGASTWDDDSNFVNAYIGRQYYTDTLNDSLLVESECVSLALTLMRNNAAGTVTEYLDGVQAGSTRDLFTTSNLCELVKYSPASRVFGTHSLIVRYTATNGSAITPETAKRRLGVAQAFAVLDR